MLEQKIRTPHADLPLIHLVEWSWMTCSQFPDKLYPYWLENQTFDEWIVSVCRSAARYVQTAARSLDEANAYIARGLEKAENQRREYRAARAAIEPSFIEKFLEELAA